jgi:hypothetical protein
MNLLPAVEAYITERVAQLRKREIPPFDTIRELCAVSSLCAGLTEQAALMDDMLSLNNPAVLKASEEKPERRVKQHD